MSMTTVANAKNFALLKQRKEELEEQVKLLNKAMEEIGKNLFEDFSTQGLKNLRIEGQNFEDGQDRIISPDPKFKGTIKDEAQFFAFLREAGNGALIKESVHHTAVEKMIMEYKENNKALPPETVLQIFTVETVKVKRAPKN